MFIKLKGFIDMEICIRKENDNTIYIDKTALTRFDKATLTQSPYNFSIIEVDKEDCEASDFNEDLTFNLDKYNKRKQNRGNQQKLYEFTNWFDNYFDKQFNQSLWQDDFEPAHDDYFDKDYASIKELKAQATIVRNEIRKLRKYLGE